ncbi:16S rRNA (cytidine(1402)-2'-O)-methyltransferase [Terriglobus albidus]|uniref:Ribosomal RNA small subunit methyltransferase I n=1 Tax=Terriglobus albidus TaxID=1592106 RepID=A0A5B9EAJ4_9BACT|nr:16S rRNA (cytidine(1402)-2'-O)-methyltransferase [Terriglobus albidus]QEE27136.1 16S rRNA (cytidine(1402)-2'-O)-methyltransferase [Terriglobus albidus]
MSEPAPLAPGLYLVATPIGNLEDITLRALRVLQSVDRIACEDTRQTQKLLNHYQIQKPTISYHQHNERSRSDELVIALQAGQRIAIVSDAGTPGIADPGVEVVAAAIAAGIPVYPIPGANAAISALIASGLSTESFTFHGFLPPKSGQRRTQLESLVLDGTTHIFYEAPHRIVETLEDVAAVFGAQHPVALAREVTKLHEEHLRGPVSEILDILKARDSIRGEFVLLLSGEPPAEEAAQAAPASIASTVDALMKQGLSEKDALKQVARDRNLGKSEVYRQWQREKTRR